MEGPPTPTPPPSLTLSVSEQQDLLSVLSVHVSFCCPIFRSVGEPGVLLLLLPAFPLHWPGAACWSPTGGTGWGGSRWFRDGGLVSFVFCLHGDQNSNTPPPPPPTSAGRTGSFQSGPGWRIQPIMSGSFLEVGGCHGNASSGQQNPVGVKAASAAC